MVKRLILLGITCLPALLLLSCSDGGTKSGVVKSSGVTQQDIDQKQLEFELLQASQPTEPGKKEARNSCTKSSNISLRDTIEGNWTTADCAATTEVISISSWLGYAKFYSFKVSSRSRITFNLTSSGDPVLILRKSRKTSGAYIQRDDDSGTGFNSKITRTLAKGTYTIEVASLKRSTYSGTESFTLTTTNPSSPCLKSIKVGKKYSGTFAAACKSTKRSGRYARYYYFTLSSSKKVTINLKSSIDTYLNLLKGKGKTGVILKSDDDGGAGRNSKIVKTLAKGSYTIEATTYASGKSGSFTLATSASGGTGDAGSIKVTTPNGGETWKAGTRYVIRWDKGNGGRFVRIFLQKSGSLYHTISRKTRNDGKHPWKVPATIATGSTYKIRIQAVTDTTVRDDSNSNFTIRKSSPSGNYQYLYNHNASEFYGYTSRWPSKRINVSGANSSSWRREFNRWPTVSFNFGASGGITIANSSAVGVGVCGDALPIWDTSGEIFSCRIRINPNYDPFDAYGGCKGVIAHEVGHCIGVYNHTSDGGLMDAAPAAGSGRITSPVRNMISLLYSLPPGTDINSRLSRRKARHDRKSNKYDPDGKGTISKLFVTPRRK